MNDGNPTVYINITDGDNILTDDIDAMEYAGNGIFYIEHGGEISKITTDGIVSDFDVDISFNGSVSGLILTRDGRKRMNPRDSKLALSYDLEVCAAPICPRSHKEKISATSTTTEPVSTGEPDPFDDACEPSKLYGLSPFQGDGSVEVIDIEAEQIYFNETTLVGVNVSDVIGWSYFGAAIDPTTDLVYSKVLIVYESIGPIWYLGAIDFDTLTTTLIGEFPDQSADIEAFPVASLTTDCEGNLYALTTAFGNNATHGLKPASVYLVDKETVEMKFIIARPCLGDTMFFQGTTSGMMDYLSYLG